MASVSVTQPISLALDRTKRVLFQPFDLRTWFVLGFCAWLATLGDGAWPNYNFSMPQYHGQPGTNPIDPLLDWVRNNLALVISIFTITATIALVISLVVMWVKSRGRFMFIDGVAKGRGAVAEPWTMYSREGNSLFLFSIVLYGATFLTGAAITAAWLLIAFPGVYGPWDAGAILSVILYGVAMLVVVFAFLLVRLVVDHLVVPSMYCRRVGIIEGWRIAKEEALSPHAGTIVLFYLMKVVLMIAIVVITTVATCATCCITALPYIGTVILLPLHVFNLSYTLHFVEQFGPEWVIFHDQDMQRCMSCGYSLRGLASGGNCPECGTAFGRSGPSSPETGADWPSDDQRQ